jgi:hypothetical protein
VLGWKPYQQDPEEAKDYQPKKSFGTTESFTRVKAFWGGSDLGSKVIKGRIQFWGKSDLGSKAV